MPKPKIEKRGRRFTAVGAYVFAGGFTLGVKQAGFDVLCHLEGDDRYGVTTVQANFPGLPVHAGPDAWPVDDLEAKGVDLVYGNPPCAAWSANNVRSHRDGSWRDDPRAACTERHFRLMVEMRPKVWVWESVCRAPDRGRELVEELTSKAVELGYSVTQVFHDARYLGVPQVRPRWFMVCHRVEVGFGLPGLPEVGTVDVLSRVVPRGGPAYDTTSNLQFDFSGMRQGEHLRDYWARTVCPPDRQSLNPNGTVKGRPSFGYKRLRSDGPACGTVGYGMVHPTEDRWLTVNEIQALAGFPDDYVFVGKGPSGNAEIDLIARGVCPPVGRWLADQVRRGLEADVEVVEPEVKVVDLRRPTTLSRPTKVAVAAEVARTPSTAVVGNGHVPQPTAKKVLPKHVDPDREFDTTALHRGGSQERTVHRDYAAHFFRWGWAGRFVDRETDLLDVGCGVDCQMLSVLSHPISNVPRSYVGVDYNDPPRRVPQRKWARFEFGFNFVERYGELGDFDLVTCFEVLEHMRKADGDKFLVGLAACLRPGGGRLLLSTPVFNGKAAANHLHEWTVPELQESVEAAGLRVVERFGTFASWNDVKKVCTPAERDLLSEVGRFYGGEVLACFLAPKYPDASRNNAWVLERA